MSDVTKEGTISVDQIKNAGDVRKVFAEVLGTVRDMDERLKAGSEQQNKMQADLEIAMEAQKKLTEAGRPQPTGFGHIKVPSACDTPRKMVDWATRIKASDYDGHAGGSIKRFQECADVAALQINIAKHIVAKGTSEDREWFNEKVMGGEIVTEYLGAAEALFAKNINTQNATEGLEWVPLEVKSSQFIDKIRDASFYAGQYVQITMAAHKFSMPALGADTDIFLVSELTGGLPATPTTPEAKPQSRQVVFNAKKMGSRSGWSRESVEDMTVSSGMIVTNNMARKMADQIDSNILFGDTDGSVHVLTPAGGSPGGAARLFDGITKQCINTAGRATDNTGNAVGWQALGGQLRRMGQAAGSRFSVTNTGSNGVIFHESWGSFFDLVKEENATYGPSPIVTLDKYGPNATIIDGEAARIFGRPIIPTEFMRTDLKNDGTWTTDATNGNTWTGSLASNVGAWGLGTRRGMELRVSTELYMESDAIVAVTFYRGDFQPLQVLATSAIADYLYNIPG